MGDVMGLIGELEPEDVGEEVAVVDDMADGRMGSVRLRNEIRG